MTNTTPEPLWKTTNFPHRGWQEVTIQDNEDELVLCVACRRQWCRYIHVIDHPQWGEIGVGCVCAENLVRGYNGKAAESAAKKKRRLHEKRLERLHAMMILTRGKPLR